ncbi:MAG TPA: hypothetical protein VGI95_05490 [Caulobacteraceae bacterium]|jgi:hypothetical protein
MGRASSVEPVHRIAVLGCSGSGKSTLAAKVAERLGLPYVPSDRVFWTDTWRPTPACQMRAWLDEATSRDRWVLDGNFDGDRDLLWERADLAIWLDLPRTLVLSQVLRRNLGWCVTGADVWGGQRMTLAKALSGVRHMLRSHGLKRRTYPDWLAALPATPVVRLRSSRELADWLATLPEPAVDRPDQRP